MSNMAFFAADTLGMTLYQLGDTLISSEVRPVRLGPWQVDLNITVASDIITPRTLTFWVTIGAVPFYLVVSEKDSWLILFEDEQLERCKATTAFAVSRTLPERMDDVESAIQQMFLWTGDRWDARPHGKDPSCWWWR